MRENKYQALSKCKYCKKRFARLSKHIFQCKKNPDPEVQERLRIMSQKAKETWKPSQILAAHSEDSRKKMGRSIAEKWRRGDYKKSQKKRLRTGAIISHQHRMKQSTAMHAVHAKKSAIYLKRALEKKDILTPLFTTDPSAFGSTPITSRLPEKAFRNQRDLWFYVEEND